jgi:hypothetical protein
MHSFSVKGVLFQKTERVISCNLDLAISNVLKVYPVISLVNFLNQIMPVLTCFVLPQFLSNISNTAQLDVINTQFYRFLKFCSSKIFFFSQMVKPCCPSE